MILLIKLFEQRRIDVLVGTQMVVKGLDFEHVNLVGILDADGLLNFADFQSKRTGFSIDGASEWEGRAQRC